MLTGNVQTQREVYASDMVVVKNLAKSLDRLGIPHLILCNLVELLQCLIGSPTDAQAQIVENQL